jgi:hypothetical protein
MPGGAGVAVGVVATPVAGPPRNPGTVQVPDGVDGAVAMLLPTWTQVL